MKILLLFMVTLMIFFLYLIPIIWPFTSARFLPEASGFAYFAWYAMVFVLSIEWGGTVRKNGCWFFNNK